MKRMLELQRALEAARLEAIETLLVGESTLASPALDPVLERLAHIQLALTALREETSSGIGRGGEINSEISAEHSRLIGRMTPDMGAVYAATRSGSERAVNFAVSLSLNRSIIPAMPMSVPPPAARSVVIVVYPNAAAPMSMAVTMLGTSVHFTAAIAMSHFLSPPPPPPLLPS